MADKIKIETGIPIPLGLGRPRRYPWRELNPGDSFFVPGATMKSLASQISWARRRSQIRLTARALDGGVRVWRLPDEDGDG